MNLLGRQAGRLPIWVTSLTLLPAFIRGNFDLICGQSSPLTHLSFNIAISIVTHQSPSNPSKNLTFTFHPSQPINPHSPSLKLYKHLRPRHTQIYKNKNTTPRHTTLPTDGRTMHAYLMYTRKGRGTAPQPGTFLSFPPFTLPYLSISHTYQGTYLPTCTGCLPPT